LTARAGAIAQRVNWNHVIAPDRSFLVEKRPVYVTRDGNGKAIEEMFA